MRLHALLRLAVLPSTLGGPRHRPVARQPQRAHRLDARRFASLCALCLLAWPPTADAYDVLRNGGGRALAWPDREVAVFLQAEPYDGMSVALLEKKLRAAMTAWSAVEGTRLKLVWGGLVREAPGLDIYVRLGHPSEAGMQAERTARLTLYSESDGRLKRAEIVLDAAFWTFTNGPSLKSGPKADLQATLTHQLGHALGLAHTPSLQAAMYFFQPEPSGRQLAEDDRRGLRFNYGPQTPMGGLCDACEGDGWCAQGVCATWPSKDSYCVRACNSHDDCPIGTSCGAWAQGKACLPNLQHCAPDLVKATASGACASDLACPSPLACLSGLGTGMCTIGCSTSCGPYGQCVSFSNGSAAIGLCLQPGTGTFGQRCTRALDCQTMLCAPGLDGGGWCTQSCASDAGCQPPAVCDTDGLCARPGPLPVGWPCGSGFDCKTGRCADHSAKGWQRVCTLPCELAGDCPAGTGCTPTGTESLCLPFGPLADDAPCTAPGACGSGSLCDVGLVPGIGACQVACDPFTDEDQCPTGKRCVWVGDKSPKWGACRGSGGGALPGGTCDATSRCRVDLVCAGVTAKEAICRADCDLDVPPGQGGGCPAGQLCVALDTTDATGKRRGACAAGGGALVQVPPAELVPSNFAAVNLSLPQVKAWTPPDDQGTEEEGAPESEGGCSAAGPHRARHDRPIALWGLALLVVGVLWRERRQVCG